MLGAILVSIAGPKCFSDIILRTPAAMNAFISSTDYPTTAKRLAHLMKIQREDKPLLDFYHINMKFLKSLLSSAVVTDLNEEQLDAVCSQLDKLSQGNPQMHAWLPHDVIIEMALASELYAC